MPELHAFVPNKLLCCVHTETIYATCAHTLYNGWMVGEHPSIHPLNFQFVLWTPLIIRLGGKKSILGVLQFLALSC